MDTDAIKTVHAFIRYKTPNVDYRVAKKKGVFVMNTFLKVLFVVLVALFGIAMLPDSTATPAPVVVETATAEMTFTWFAGSDCIANRATGDFYPHGQNSSHCELHDEAPVVTRKANQPVAPVVPVVSTPTPEQSATPPVVVTVTSTPIATQPPATATATQPPTAEPTQPPAEATATPKGNNGHGNNRDRCDSSNPSNKCPDKQEDESAPVDDEVKPPKAPKPPKPNKSFMVGFVFIAAATAAAKAMGKRDLEWVYISNAKLLGGSATLYKLNGVTPVVVVYGTGGGEGHPAPVLHMEGFESMGKAGAWLNAEAKVIAQAYR